MPEELLFDQCSPKHPGRRVRGLCTRCYQRWYYAEQVAGRAPAKKRRPDRARPYHKDHGTPLKRAYRQRHPERAVALKHRRRSRETGTLTAVEWTAILEEFDYRCAYCNADGRTQLEHMTPVSRGGRTDRHNCVPACADCNARKGARTALEFAGA